MQPQRVPGEMRERLQTHCRWLSIEICDRCSIQSNFFSFVVERLRRKKKLIEAAANGRRRRRRQRRHRRHRRRRLRRRLQQLAQYNIAARSFNIDKNDSYLFPHSSSSSSRRSCYLEQQPTLT